MTTSMIAKNGVYNTVDIDTYHSQRCCVGVSTSSSALKIILAECPAKFWAQTDINEDGKRKPATRALNFGKAAHALVLGEPEFYSHFIVSPHDDFRTKEARAWRDDQTRQVLKAEEFLIVCDMADALRKSPQLQRAFTNGKPEVTIVYRDPDTGIWLKTRPDWFPNDHTKEFICEYKTAESIKPEFFSSDCFKYGYHVQAAISFDVTARVTGKEPLGIAHIVQKKTPPYLAELRMFTSEQINFGRLLYRKALNTLAHCLKTNDWPGYTTDPQYIQTPYRVLKQMENFSGTDDNAAATAADEYSISDYANAG